MAENTYKTYVLFSGRGEDIYNNVATLLATGEDDAIELFESTVSEGLASKNDGLYLAPISPEMTEEEHNLYHENNDKICDIILGKDEKFHIGDIVRKYAAQNSDWIPEALDIVYDNDETDFHVTMKDRG